MEVKNLASYAPGLVARQLADDWQRERGYRPVLLETYVNREEHKGTCYRAANWQWIGMTRVGRPSAGGRRRCRRPCT